jgi:hypothetical protein
MKIKMNEEIYNQTNTEELVKYHINKLFKYATEFENIFMTKEQISQFNKDLLNSYNYEYWEDVEKELQKRK